MCEAEYCEFLNIVRRLFWGSVDYTSKKIHNDSNRKLFLDVSFKVGTVLINSYDYKNLKKLKRSLNSLELKIESERVIVASLLELLFSNAEYSSLPFEIINDILKNLELRFITGFDGNRV